jgi:hypothetical protein
MKKIVLFSLVLIMGSLAVEAQPGNPVNPVPVDGGISLLIAAGAAFGAKKLSDRRKSRSGEKKAG